MSNSQAGIQSPTGLTQAVPSALFPTAPLSVPGGLSHPLPPLPCMFPPPCIHFGLFPQPGVQCPQLNLAKAHLSNTTPSLSFQNSPCSSSAVYDALGFIHSSMLSFTISLCIHPLNESLSTGCVPGTVLCTSQVSTHLILAAIL